MCGFIAQLVEHRTGIAEVTGSNPVEALIFFRLRLSSCLNWKIYCDDHSSLSSILMILFPEIQFKLILDLATLWWQCVDVETTENSDGKLSGLRNCVSFRREKGVIFFSKFV